MNSARVCVHGEEGRGFAYIYSDVDEFWSVVSAILDRPAVRKDSDLHDQISRANESIGSNMVEGFDQGTDRASANLLCYSKGSVSEVLKRLRKVYYRGYISADELTARVEQGEVAEDGLGQPRIARIRCR